MTPARLEFEGLPNDQLLDEVRRLALRERVATADLLRCLIEVDTRRLYLREGCASLFTYCTQVLHLAEGAAYNRIEAARGATLSARARTHCRRLTHIDLGTPARAAPDRGESRHLARRRTPQGKARRRAADRDVASTAASADRAQKSCFSLGMEVMPLESSG